MDDLGRNYGSWMTLKSFEQHLREGKAEAIGFCFLNMTSTGMNEPAVRYEW
jgi:hypothetical protein